MPKDKSDNLNKNGHNFGTFGGVFTPSVLTILGVIMYLRYAQVVGEAGLWGSLLILFAATIISLITGLSISSISTNMQVKGGGAYYLISRSLGVEFGGLIATFFYIAQALAVALYVIGFTEAIFAAFPEITLSFRVVAMLTNMIVFTLVYIGAGWTIKVQYGILAVVMLSLLSFIIGAMEYASLDVLRSNLQPAFTGDNSIFTMFALFFPAVTGVMVGVNMSGDLKEPRRSIPRGVLTAIAFTTLIYIAVALLLAASSNRETLLSGSFVMKDVSWKGALIYAGVFTATISSALGSMMGAPRILQAFAKDNVFKQLHFFGKGEGPSNEPRRAIILTFLISSLGIMAGDLNTIAPIITMFFLITYGTVNLACFYEMISHNPSFRPSFRLHHWFVALLGTLGSLAVMFLVSPVWAFIAIVLSSGMYFIILHKKINVQWGDIKSGWAYQRARKALFRLEQEKYHPKNWRPSILTLSGGAWNRSNLVHYACLFSADCGIVSLAQIMTGKLADRFVQRDEAERLMRKFIIKEKLPAFPVVVVDESFTAGLKALLQVHGIGGLRPNTLLLGWTKEPDNIGVFSTILDLAKNMHRSVVVVRSEQEQDNWEVPGGAINIWWNDSTNGPLSLLIGFLLKQDGEWRSKPLRILRTVAPKADVDNLKNEIAEMLILSRIEAEVVVLPCEDPFEAIRDNMQPSAVLFTGFIPESETVKIKAQMEELKKVMTLPGEVILVYNAGDASLME
ncbi:MAG: amino acid permease [Candidatus Neomarinimicrobiota bacterium]|nr:MAG: amino acid permease [Candidatus Neomarinimicrobiota bacterium]